jgi:hypothetical protein
MESQDVTVRRVLYNGAPIHVISAAGDDFCFSRAAEWALYGSTSHSGSLNKALKTLGQPSPIVVRTNALPPGINLTDYQALLLAYREFQLALDNDSTVRPPKMLSIVLVTSVAEVCVDLRGNLELLEVLGCPVPEAWVLADKQAALAKEHLVDLMLNEEIDLLNERNQVSLAEEIIEFVTFAESPADEIQLKGYAMQPTRHLTAQLNAFVQHKTATFAHNRESAAVRGVTATSDVQSILRLCGWLWTVEVRISDLRELRTLAPERLQEYCTWLIEQRAIKYGSVSNYLNGIQSVLEHLLTIPMLESDNDESIDRLDELMQATHNLRSQAEREAKEQRLYRARKPDWISWATAKVARESAMAAMRVALKKRPANRSKQLLAVSQALVISLLTVMPPDRCGVVRRLAFGDTLKKRDGSYHIDLTSFKHKTSRYYGPSMTPISPRLTELLDTWLAMTQTFEFDELDPDATRTQRRYLFTQKNDPNRCVDSSGFTAFVKASFKEHTPNGEAPCPTLLRSAFITTLRETTTDNEILKSAAIAQKHSITMQSSDVYDLETHVRLTQKAMEWCEGYADGNLEQTVRTDLERTDVPHENSLQDLLPDNPLPDDPLPDDPLLDDPLPDEPLPDEPMQDDQHPPVSAMRFVAPLAPINNNAALGTMPTSEFEVELVTGGRVVSGKPRHRILWNGYPELQEWWGNVEPAFVFHSATYVGREILLTKQGQRSGNLAIIASIIGTNTCELQLAGGSTVMADLVACDAKHETTRVTISWSLTRPETWLIPHCDGPLIMNDCCFGFDSLEAKAARGAWLDAEMSNFPTLEESLCILRSANDDMSDHVEMRDVVPSILRLFDGGDNSHKALDNLGKLSRVFQQGSLMHDSVQILITVAHRM